MSKALSMIKKYCSDDLFDDEEEEENEYTKEMELHIQEMRREL